METIALSAKAIHLRRSITRWKLCGIITNPRTTTVFTKFVLTTSQIPCIRLYGKQSRQEPRMRLRRRIGRNSASETRNGYDANDLSNDSVVWMADPGGASGTWARH